MIRRSDRRAFLESAARGLCGLAVADALTLDAFAQPATSRYNGFIVARLKPGRFGSLITSVNDLRTLARQSNAAELLSVLNQYPDLVTGHLVSALNTTEVNALERRASETLQWSLNSYWTIDARTVTNRDQIVRLLRGVPDVDLAYEQANGTDPAAVDPSNDQFAGQQFHLNPAPEGIDARWAWSHGAGAIPLFGFVDVERGWILPHQDMPTIRTLRFGSTEMDTASLPHGTACVSLAAGRDNDRGIVGVAPRPAWTAISSHIRRGVPGKVAEAIAVAAHAMTAGDVILVEWSTDQDLPAEMIADVWTVIRAATSAGIVVVEAAGNGNASLDPHPELRDDSGAIIVGASHRALDSSGTGHERWVITLPSGTKIGSNFGARVDCYAPGEQLVTAGPAKTAPGSLTPGATSDRLMYRRDFGATSGAAAIVAGAALLLQQWHQAAKGRPLTPAQMRATLRTHGTPQGTGVPGRIGRMPDLKKVDVALRLQTVHT